MTPLIAAIFTVQAGAAPTTSAAATPADAARWTAVVSDAPSRSETWVRVTVRAETAEPHGWDLTFVPTPLVRHLHVEASASCEMSGEGYRITRSGAASELRLALRVGPGTEGALRLGAMSAHGVERTLEVNLSKAVRDPPRPRQFRRCRQAPRETVSTTRFAVSKACDLSETFVMLDPGHGPGVNTGGVSATGVDEYVFNDLLAIETRKAIRARAPVRVELTREATRNRPLRARVKRVNREAPDLLLSLHHDSVADAERLTLVRDGQELRSCEEHYGFSLYLDTVDEFAPASYHAARRLSDRLMAAGRPVGRYFFWGQVEHGIYNGDVLYLLRNVEVPAVLLENGFICNYDEERRLQRPAFRRKLASLIADSVLEFLTERKCGAAPKLDATGLIWGE